MNAAIILIIDDNCDWATIMIKKHYILIVIVLLLVVGTIVSSKRENDKIIALCRDALSSSPFIDATDLKYSYMDGRTVYFYYRQDIAFCHVRRNGSEWEVDNGGFLGISTNP
jgi:hypothetical protein